MRVLLLGGSGTLSSAILKKSLSCGYDVTIFNRGNNNKDVPSDVTTIRGDFYNQGSLLVFRDKNYDVVVDFLSRKPADIERVYPVFKTICKQYIFISTACVYCRKKEDFPIVESSPKPNTKWAYNVEKYNCELKLKELSDKKNNYYTIVRPYITYDDKRIPFGIAPEYKFHRTIIERIKAGKPMFIWNHGNALTTSTYVSEFADGVVGLFLNDKAVNEDFHITSSNSYHSVEVLKLLYEKLGVNSNIIDVHVDELVKSLPQFKDMLIGDRALDAIFDNTKIISAVPDFEANTSVSEGLDKVLRNYELLNTFDYDYRYDAMVDRLLSKKSANCHYVRYKNADRKTIIVYFIYRYLPYSLSIRLNRILSVFKLV